MLFEKKYKWALQSGQRKRIWSYEIKLILRDKRCQLIVYLFHVFVEMSLSCH